MVEGWAIVNKSLIKITTVGSRTVLSYYYYYSAITKSQNIRILSVVTCNEGTGVARSTVETFSLQGLLQSLLLMMVRLVLGGPTAVILYLQHGELFSRPGPVEGYRAWWEGPLFGSAGSGDGVQGAC